MATEMTRRGAIRLFGAGALAAAAGGCASALTTEASAAGPALPGTFGKVYGRNILFRDGHVKFETEETMRRPKQ